MSIPDRLGRIMRHKLNEIKDKFDQLDEEALADPAEIERLKRAEARLAAKQEMEEAMHSPDYSRPNLGSSSSSANATRPPQPAPYAAASAPANLRTPEQISGAAQGAVRSANPSSAQMAAQDPLEYHYKMLGVPTGSDFAEVVRAYNALSSRISSSQFQPNSKEAMELNEIKDRLEISYKALREALDTTAHRFGMLEFDSRSASNG
jgi:hypothetical protein